MALILKDRVKETTTTTSTGTVTLLGAADGYQSFAAIGNGNTCYYTIAAQTTNEWEVGIGTYTSPDQLSRDTVLSSSNSGSLVVFSAGTKDVFVTQPAEKAIYTDASNIVNTSGNGANTVTFTNVNTTNLTANTVTLTAGTISTNAANATDITNKQYVDGLVLSGTHFHEPVLVEEDVALVAVYNQPNGAGNGVGATLTNNGANAALVVDGVSVSNTARILVYAQANAVQNGVYTVTNPGNASAQWVLTRSTDTDTFGLASSTQLSEGSTFFVTAGNTGAGRTYTCNTQGTITFGSTNITFAQISSAQIYSAGTGLNLSNLTFSISNTAVTAATYGDSGNVAQVTVNAQGQLTNAANVAINASSITLGTLSNDRTTASASNGANTIVLRDANGSFNANVVTATTVNATNGNFTNITANASGLTDINASNITSGTISNARTTGDTANSASTIVLRDASGNFGSNVISASLFSGDGSAINAINASNISSGTIANARTTAASANGASTIVQRDSGGDFAANTITASFSGNGVAITAINASSLSVGTVDSARISGAYTNITGVGALASGTWNANVISAQYGGTGSANLTADNVILGNGASTVKVVAPGTANNVLTSNGSTWISQAPAAAGGFPAGTVMLFAQTSAPTGWTKNTIAGDNSALRVVTGTAGTGGSVAFTTAFASQTPSGTVANQTATNQSYTPAGSVSITGISGSASATTLATSQLASHTHTENVANNAGGFGGRGPRGENTWGGATASNMDTVAAGGNGSHTHGFSFSSGTASFGGTPATITQNAHNHTFTGAAINLAVQYIDVIRATKD